MALRTSGHLLLGVVKIYSRKAKYLLADCNEAFVKIKMAFRPGVVDLPDETNREAAIAAITLPENIHDFEATIADINEININTMAINQSRPEDITMREDFGEINLGRQDDDFGDSAFDEVSSREIIREGEKSFADGIYRGSDQLSVHHAGDFTLNSGHDMDGTLIDVKRDSRLRDSDKHMKPMNSASHPDDIGIDDNDFEDNFLAEPDDDDENFGGGLVHSLFTDGIFEDPVAQKQLEHLTSEIESHMANDRFDLGGSAAAVSTATGGQQRDDNDGKRLENFVPTTTYASTDDGLGKLPSESITNSKVGLGMTTMTTESTTLITNESEAFALPPIDTTSATGMEPRRAPKRKRRLIVDEQKSIPSEIMKSQMENTSDITTQLDLAPPTKKLMNWKETGSVDKLFTLPGRAIPSRVLLRLFIRNLYTQNVPDDAPDETWHTAAMGPNLSSHLIQTGSSDTLCSRSNSLDRSAGQPYSPAMSHLKEAPHSAEKLGIITELSEEEAEQPVRSDKLATSPDSAHELPDSRGNLDDEEIHDDLAFMVEPETPYLAPPSILSEAPPSVMQVDMLALERELAAADMEVENEMAMKSAASFLPTDLAGSDAIAAVDNLNLVESVEEKRLEKRSKVLLRLLYHHQQQTGWAEPLSLQNLCVGNTKKQAASKFYTVLLLCKQGAVSLAQESAYGNIHISRGQDFFRLVET